MKKDVSQLVFTNKDSYINYREIIEIAYYLKHTYNTNTIIKVAGKNKSFLKFHVEQMEAEKYKKIYDDMKNIDVYIYKETKKHNDRVKRQEKNSNRIAEEKKLNEDFQDLFKKYPKILC